MRGKSERQVRAPFVKFFVFCLLSFVLFLKYKIKKKFKHKTLVKTKVNVTFMSKNKK
jgi:hypothetical protein